MGGFLSSFASFFRRKSPKTPVKGCFPRIKSFLTCHWRGLIGIFIPLIVLLQRPEKGNNAKTAEIMWMWMFWFFLWQPVPVPVTATIPIFLLPMTGVMNTVDVCDCYFNENIALFILTGMLILLLNNSGVDRRIALWLICSGDNCQFSGKRLVFKCSTAAFFLSMFSNRLIVASAITQYMTPALMDMHTNRGGSGSPNYKEMRHIINSAIQTSSAIGSTAIVHASVATMVFRGIFSESPKKGQEYEDIFNYMQYSAFVFPVALIQFMINFGYHMILINKFAGVKMPASGMTELQRSLVKLKSTLPKRVTLHEKFSVFFMISALIIFFFRWCPWLNMGWAAYNEVKAGEKSLPTVKDSTVAAIFVLAMHILPKGFGFVDYLSADTKSQLPPIKPESAILWWKFVDKNLNYGYMFVIGGGIALCNAVRESGLGTSVTENIGKILFTKHAWNASVFLVCLVASLLSNVMSGVGTVISLMPIILHMNTAGGGEPAPAPVPRLRRQDADTAPAPAEGDAGAPAETPNLWPNREYLGALAIGLCGSYGFILPFVYTPAYICRHTGKTPIRKMIKYSSFSVVICLIVLWIALLHWAPVVWDPEDKGFTALEKGGGAADAGGAEAPAEPAPGP